MIKQACQKLSLLVGPLLLVSCGIERPRLDTRASQLPDKGMMLAAACASCHAPLGGAAPDHMPNIENLTSQELEQSLLSYKYDESGTTVMHRLARGYSEADIKLIAQSLSNSDAHHHD